MKLSMLQVWCLAFTMSDVTSDNDTTTTSESSENERMIIVDNLTLYSENSSWTEANRY